MKKKIACVYLIENLINCKKYIGQSINLKYFECCTQDKNGKRTGMGHGSPYICPFKN